MRGRTAWLIAGLTGSALLAGGVAYAQIPGADGVIKACYSKGSGNLRAIDSAASCRKSETSLNWNQKGQAGADGADGTDGVDATLSPVYQGTDNRDLGEVSDEAAIQRRVALCDVGDTVLNGRSVYTLQGDTQGVRLSWGGGHTNGLIDGKDGWDAFFRTEPKTPFATVAVAVWCLDTAAPAHAS
jgi:hypothetical protein